MSTPYRCLVITRFEKREAPKRLKEEVEIALEPLLGGGAAGFGWNESERQDRGQLAGGAPPADDVVLLKDWDASAAAQVQAVVLPNGDVHLLAAVVGERPATVLKGGAELRKYDRDAWSHFLEAEAKIRQNKVAVKVTFDDWDDLLQGGAR